MLCKKYLCTIIPAYIYCVQILWRAIWWYEMSRNQTLVVPNLFMFPHKGVLYLRYYTLLNRSYRYYNRRTIQLPHWKEQGNQNEYFV